MRRVPLVPIALAILGCAGVATDPPPATTATPLAFEIESKGGARAVLFGSVHVARANEWALPEELSRALAEAELLVLEIDLEETSADEMLQLMLELGVMPPGQQLRQVVSPETWALLEQRAPETGIALEHLERLKPWVVALQFVGLSLQRAGFESEHGVEQGLIEHAPKLPVRGLETPYEQLATFDELPYPVQDRMLNDALRPREGREHELEALMEAWRRGDARSIEAIVFRDRDDPQLARFYEETYDRRNARMAESLGEILEEGHRTFVVVGAAHLVGARSIPRLLRDSGYAVRQISGQR